jgi:hypothetical protein
MFALGTVAPVRYQRICALLFQCLLADWVAAELPVTSHLPLPECLSMPESGLEAVVSKGLPLAFCLCSKRPSFMEDDRQVGVLSQSLRHLCCMWTLLLLLLLLLLLQLSRGTWTLISSSCLAMLSIRARNPSLLQYSTTLRCSPRNEGS